VKELNIKIKLATIIQRGDVEYIDSADWAVLC